MPVCGGKAAFGSLQHVCAQFTQRMLQHLLYLLRRACGLQRQMVVLV